MNEPHRNIRSSAALHQELGCKDRLSFDAAMAVMRRLGEVSGNTMWPTLSGSEVHAFANAAIEAHLAAAAALAPTGETKGAM